ncbi:hypothetical protein IVB38_17880 [Bradyrhizobium sp. 38]|uniref:hypothetical protein n=1 Tax=unclassified Bradyrhizobium TaxID=2631580 RepID=UPI001FF889E0|nr:MULTISPECIES: hypothetical protein [unclassified Bradyrhizobium]MCK1337840.1 hypothetical protein [Bradyrhizobium sp. 38]MCK1782296.1 hypothetical protein [Bradyrhizobium sp. 132]
MDLPFTDEERRFREEMRLFLREGAADKDTGSIAFINPLIVCSEDKGAEIDDALLVLGEKKNG